MTQDPLFSALKTSERIKSQLAAAPEQERPAVLADVLADFILSLPSEAQTPLLTKFLWGVEALVEERSFPATVGTA
jgi:hypothetical protein